MSSFVEHVAILNLFILVYLSSHAICIDIIEKYVDRMIGPQ